jgi:starvation-inducible outer membrane lipoprotein
MKLEEKHILFRGEKITYTDAGKGRVIVLLHGFLDQKKYGKQLNPHLVSISGL